MAPQHRPFVPENVKMKEFTLRAVLLGLVMSVVLGAANAYLGLNAGQTIAATYPAAVIGMAVLRGFKGSILEENIARTAGSIGESVAAGAIFTIPAFRASPGSWTSFDPAHAYWKSTALMMVGSVLGVLFVSLVRRALVEDPELPFPESRGRGGDSQSRTARRRRRAISVLQHRPRHAGAGAGRAVNLFAADKDFHRPRRAAGQELRAAGRRTAAPNVLQTGAVSTVAAPTVSPALIGVGYVIGPELAALNFSGSVLAWGVAGSAADVFPGPAAAEHSCRPDASDDGWAALATAVWRFIVRPIAVGGMMVGAAYTLFRMRKNLTSSLGRAIRRTARTARRRSNRWRAPSAT